MWFWVWVLLVVAALAYLFLVGRGLWRRFRGIFTEFSASADRADQITGSVDERTEALLAAQPSTAPTIGADPIELFTRVDHLRTQRLDRKLNRRRPRPDVFNRWLSVYR